MIEAKSSAKTKIFMRGGPSIMATTRIMPLHVGKGRTESRAISDIIDYVANPTLSVLSPFLGCDATVCHAFLADSWNKAFSSD